jgi:drug/metabolite transporter (DMT)-like permease
MIIAAGLLWSISSVFMRLLQQSSPLHVDEPALSPLQIAFFRSLFAGVGLMILLRPKHITLRPAMGLMVLCFGIMTGLYVTALGLGPAANAILLQNTAPVWIYFLGVYLFKDPRDKRTLKAVLLGLAGALVIVIGNWPRGLDAEATAVQGGVLAMAAGSGLFYAFVVLLLRNLAGESSTWLVVLNMLGSAAVIALYILATEGLAKFAAWLVQPSPRQYAFLLLYGLVQLAGPYWLFVRGLRRISPQEAGILTLVEPVLNPMWAWMIAPDRDTPTVWTALGGGVLLAALAWRYWPLRTNESVRRTSVGQTNSDDCASG